MKLLGMLSILILGSLAAVPSFGASPVASPVPSSSASSSDPAELDAYWAEISRTVAEGDFDGYAAGYHPDAVLVSLGGGTSYPISEALAGWKQGFDDTREGKMSASVDFKFTRRLYDESTAHDTGMFRYTSQNAGEEAVVKTVHFEALFVKMDGAWKMMMEFQKDPASAEEWDAAG